MKEKLTQKDVEKIQQEIDHRKLVVRKEARSSHLRGFSIPFRQGGLFPRLATSCYFLSNHLQM